MAAPRHYDEDLRSIGQALEAKEISVFELKHLASSYIIRGTPEPTRSLYTKVLRWFQRLRSGSASESLILGLADIEKMSEAGRRKRSNPGQLTNFRSISNLLRTIGAYLDFSEFELVELHKRPISITLSYRDKAGHDQKEDRTISSFYKLFLELCEKRAQKTVLPSGK
ncbi:MAG TPA: hypothetical protein VGB27_15185 [Candidatus Binatia bacterium]